MVKGTKLLHGIENSKFRYLKKFDHHWIEEENLSKNRVSWLPLTTFWERLEEAQAKPNVDKSSGTF